MSDFTISSPTPKRIFAVDALSIRVYEEKKALAQDAALFAHNYLQFILTRQKIATVVLATGNSQIEFLKALTTQYNLDWSRIICFHLDEYLGITADNPASFGYYLQHKVDKQISLHKFHYLKGDALQPLEECARYSKLLQKQPLDLCLLGIGNNGHLAFNEPTVADFVDSQAVKIVRLEEINRQQQVNGGYFTSLEAVPQYAYTLTIPTICSAKKILCLAPGLHKAEIVNKMLKEAIKEDCPASILRRQKQAILFLDRHSASLV